MRNKGKVHPSPNSTTTAAADAFSLLKLLPAAILSLLTILSLQEREALAYMLSISLHSSSSSAAAKKPPQCPHNSPPLLHCDCFHCYTAFWLRWDSSPNRLLIHRAIDAFELQLTAAAAAPKTKKRRDKFSRRSKPSSPENQERRISAAALPPPPPAEVEVGELSIPGVSVEKTEVAAPAPSHKGLAWKVLPDVMGIFSSRLWRLWSPNV